VRWFAVSWDFADRFSHQFRGLAGGIPHETQAFPAFDNQSVTSRKERQTVNVRKTARDDFDFDFRLFSRSIGKWPRAGQGGRQADLLAFFCLGLSGQMRKECCHQQGACPSVRVPFFGRAPTIDHCSLLHVLLGSVIKQSPECRPCTPGISSCQKL